MIRNLYALDRRANWTVRTLFSPFDCLGGMNNTIPVTICAQDGPSGSVRVAPLQDEIGHKFLFFSVPDFFAIIAAQVSNLSGLVAGGDLRPPGGPNSAIAACGFAI